MHGGEGSIKFAVKALALAKSAASAFGPPLLETEFLETDLMGNIIFSRVAFADWNLICTQIKSMEAPVSLADLKDEQGHSRKAMELIQTPRKSKPKPNPDEDEWFAQDNDEDSLSSLFDKIDTFNLEENQNGRPVKDRLTLIKVFLEEPPKNKGPFPKPLDEC